MERWEYLRLTVTCGKQREMVTYHSGALDKLTADLDEDTAMRVIGEEGWELVGFAIGQTPEQLKYYVFKRKRQSLA